MNARAEKHEVTPSDVATAEMLLADARAMSEAMASVATMRPAMGGYREGYMDASTLRSSIAESEARLAVLKEQLAQIPAVADDKAVSYDDVNRLQTEEQRARSELDMAQSAINELRRNNSRSNGSGSFTLTVLDGSAVKTER